MLILSKVITYASIVSPLLVIWIGRKERVLLWWYAITGLFFDIFFIPFKILNIDASWQGNLFVVLEFLIVISYYSKYLVSKRYFYIISGILLAFFIAHTLYLRPYDATQPVSRLRFNLTAAAVLYLWYIILAITGFYKLITGPLVDNILKSRFFWVNVTFLVYASGVFFMFMFAEPIRKQDIALGAMLWSTVFCGLNIVKNSFLAKALSIPNGPVES